MVRIGEGERFNQFNRTLHLLVNLGAHKADGQMGANGLSSHSVEVALDQVGKPLPIPHTEGKSLFMRLI